jgi:glycine hydroxymethyltransferase
VRALAKEHKPQMIVAGASAYALRIDWKKFREIADEVGAYFFVDMAHYAGLIAAGLYPTPLGIADFVTTTTHKDAARPARRRDPRQGRAREGLELGDLSVDPGRAAHARDRREGDAFQEALQPGFKDYQKQVLANAKIMADTLTQPRAARGSGARKPPLLVDLRAKKATGKDAEAALGAAHITVNKNAIPNDPEKPFVTSGIRIGSPAMTTRGFKDARRSRSPTSSPTCSRRAATRKP